MTGHASEPLLGLHACRPRRPQETEEVALAQRDAALFQTLLDLGPVEPEAAAETSGRMHDAIVGGRLVLPVLCAAGIVVVLADEPAIEFAGQSLDLLGAQRLLGQLILSPLLLGPTFEECAQAGPFLVDVGCDRQEAADRFLRVFGAEGVGDFELADQVAQRHRHSLAEPIHAGLRVFPWSRHAQGHL